jgi:hypothetical protein
MSTCLSGVPKELVVEHAEEIIDCVADLLNEDEFNRAVTYGPNGTKQVRYRFEAMKAALTEVLYADRD